MNEPVKRPPGRPRLSDDGLMVAVTIGLSPAHVAKLERLAIDQDRTKSAIIRRLLDRTPDVTVAS